MGPSVAVIDALRFWAKVDIGAHDECWLWTAGVTHNGYGQFRIRNPRRHVYAHRWAYEQIFGPIPEGFEIDHICHWASGCSLGDACLHRRCINPAHMESVTHGENLLRSEPHLRTHCPQGHAFTDQNTYRWRGQRRCRQCGRERAATYRQAQKAVQ